MSSIENSFYNALDSIITTCRIISSSGTALDFKYMVLELNYYEDIYSNEVSGNMLINDSVNYLNLLQFDGNERVVISLDNPSKNTPLERSFRLFKVSNRTQTKELNENYILHFCSEELMLSEQSRISKSYKKTEISNIVNSICVDYLKIPRDKLFIENTIGLRDIIIPGYKPFQALNWLCSLSLSIETSSIGTTYLYYENKNGFNFSSLASLYKQPTYRTFMYDIKNLHKPDDYMLSDDNKEVNSVISYKHINNFDTLANSNRGTFNNKLITFDPLRGSFGENDFNYSKFSKDSPSLNKYNFETDSTNRFDKTSQDTTSMVKFVMSTLGQSEHPYIKNKNITINENKIENTIPFRVAQLALLNSNKMKLVIPGDVNMTVGLVIQFNLPTLSRKEFGEDEFDQFYSGRYLVTGIRHIIQQESKFITVVEICKDSIPNSMAPTDNNNQTLNFLK
jgi:hypothetical protein